MTGRVERPTPTHGRALVGSIQGQKRGLSRVEADKHNHVAASMTKRGV